MRKINFNAGPSAMPLPALELAQKEMLNFEGTGMSIMEHSHRGKDFLRVHEEAKALLRELMEIPSTHEVLFMQGGASMQFALVPMNFLKEGKSADYVVTGTWGKKALEEAQRVGKARAAWQQTDAQGRYVRVPKQSEVSFDAHACYVHTTSNNTLYGSQYWEFLDTGKLWQVCDMSSDILSRRVEVSQFGLIYAGAQKNLGPAGLVVVVVHKAFLEEAAKQLPLIFRYATFAEHDSLLNTPSTFGIYMLRNCLRWLKAEGGVSAMAERNEKKARALYAVLDELPDFYVAPVEKESRSQMNVVFHLKNPALDEAFVKAAAAENMAGVKGHRSTGGMRASIYNAVNQQDVEALAAFMRRFAR